MAFEDCAVADYQAKGGYVANHGSWRLNFQFLFSDDIGHHFALHENRLGRYFALYGRLLSHRHMGLRNDLAVDFTVDGRLALEMEFAINFRAGTKIRAHIRRHTAGSIRFCHSCPPFELAYKYKSL